MTAQPDRRLPRLPALVDGVVSHHRPGPVRHAFRHRVYQWLVDLDRVPEPPWYLRPWATFHAEDHLGDPTRTIKQNVEAFLATHGVRLGDDSQVLMLANARVLGHVFDPLTVFWCFDGAGALRNVIAEVHNTYGDRHAYLLRPNESGSAYADKRLYVSPFFDVSGDYSLRFELSPERVRTTVTLRRDEQVAFSATFSGRPTPATRGAVAAHACRRPLMTQRVSVLIRMHAVWLWLRRLPIRPRPQHRAQEGV